MWQEHKEASQRQRDWNQAFPALLFPLRDRHFREPVDAHNIVDVLAPMKPDMPRIPFIHFTFTDHVRIVHNIYNGATACIFDCYLL